MMRVELLNVCEFRLSLGPSFATIIIQSVCFVVQWFVFFFNQEHSGRVFRLQFDDFQIVSSSHDDTILIWDFLNVPSTQEIDSYFKNLSCLTALSPELRG